MIDATEPIRLSEERLEILRLVENQTITAEEAGRLLEALDRSDRSDRSDRAERGGNPSSMPRPMPAPGAPPPPRRPGRNVRIRITDLDEDEQRLNLVLPHPLLDAGLKMAKRMAPEQILDAKEIKDAVDEGFIGALLDIVEGQQRVEIIVEPRQPAN